jgi:ubiquinone/menaquinone biosynthesis C-methylase UbiE
VNSGERRNTSGQDTNPDGGNRRPYQKRSENSSGDRPPRRTSDRAAEHGKDRRGDSRPGRGGARRGYKEYDPATAPTKRGARTGWDAVASWYDGWVGKDGSKHHQQLAIPATMELLELKEDEKLLDIGAGQGVLATYVTQVGAEYTGVDVSPRLLDLAKKHHGMYGHFVQADACKLAQSNELQEAGYDAATFLLSLQDINPLQDALHSVSWALKPGGRVVLLMTHPCFRIPRQSGWGYDENRKLTYRRVDHYMTPLNVPMKSYLGGSGVTISFHRPLHEYVNGLAAAGFVIDQMREITSYKAEENAAESEIPVFMAIRARKLNI